MKTETIKQTKGEGTRALILKAALRHASEPMVNASKPAMLAWRKAALRMMARVSSPLVCLMVSVFMPK